MKNTVMKSAGSFAMLTISQTSSSPTRIAAKNGMMYALAGRRRRIVVSWVASLVTALRRRRARGARRRPFFLRLPVLGGQALRWNDGLQRIQLPRFLLVDRDRVQARVALVVDREIADDPVLHRQAEEALGDVGAGHVGRLGNGVEH